MCFIFLVTKTLNGLDDFNAGAGDPDLGGGCSVPPPAEHVLPQLEVLEHHNKVLVEALGKVFIVDGSLVSPGAALREGANGQVRLRLLLPFLAEVHFPGVPPVGLVLRELENVLNEAFLSEALLAFERHLAQPVGVSSAMPDCNEANGLDAAASPLGHLGWEDNKGINGSGSVGPGAPVFQAPGFFQANPAWGPGVVCAIEGGRTAVRVPAMDATTTTENRRHPRCCPGVLPVCTSPSSICLKFCKCPMHMLVAMIHVGVGAFAPPRLG